MNTSLEDYMRSIYHLYETSKDKEKGIQSVDLAKSLSVTKASVSLMLKKLSSLDYIDSKPYKKIFLTSAGLKEARRIMHNHRVIEVFLKDILNYNDPKKIHEEAHILEHAFSQNTLDRLDKFLSNPKKSPTGEVIPHENTI